jgi:hypothetical protein
VFQRTGSGGLGVVFFMKRKVELPQSLEEVRSLDDEKLQALWMRYHKEPSKMRGQSMHRMLWYDIQCEVHNVRIEQKNITRLNRYSTDPDRHIEKSYKTKYHLRTGMMIIKSFKDREHKVLVKAPDEFIYNNESYKTLSAVAMVICGSKVSGYDFFGLNNKHYEKNIIEETS